MRVKCRHCGSSEFVKAGKTNGKQRYRCHSCLRHYSVFP